MAENEIIISADNLKELDLNLVDSIQLKDGTVVVVQDEGENDNQFIQESET